MRDFLNESELTERRAFIESFVKEIIVMPGDALHAIHRAYARRQPDTRQGHRKGGPERLSSVYRHTMVGRSVLNCELFAGRLPCELPGSGTHHRTCRDQRPT